MINGLAEIGALIGDPARATMLSLLLDGGAHSAKALALSAGVSPQTASWHLARLAEGRLLLAEKQGRQRYFRLASPLVARTLEDMLTVAAAAAPCSRRPPRIDAALRAARTCYDHLAGRLGVALTAMLVEHRHVLLAEDGGRITAAGARFLDGFGVELAAAAEQKRAYCRPCLDWSERRPHMAGAMGAALAARCFALGWLAPIRDSRAVRVTDAGRRGFARVFGIAVP